MASATKKGSKNKDPKLRRPKMKASPREEPKTIAELRRQLEDRDQQVAEALQRESATGRENERLSNALTEALEANCYW